MDHLEASFILLMDEMEKVCVPPQPDEVLLDTEACVWEAAIMWPDVTNVEQLRSLMTCRSAVGGVAGLPGGTPAVASTVAILTFLAAAGTWYVKRSA